MALVTKRIYRISGNHSALNAQQIGVESSADGDLGFKMYGGKDDAGNITKFLAKGKPAILSTLNLSGGSTTGDTGLLKHDALGDITGGQLTVAQFNTYISDGGFLWTRDAVNGRVAPLTASDSVVSGDGTAAAPGFVFASSKTSGLYYGTVSTAVTGVGVSYNGAEIVGFSLSSGDAILYGAPDQDFSIIHERVAATGTSEMLIKNEATQNGIQSHMVLECAAVSAISDITLISQNQKLDAYQYIDLESTIGTITLQTQGGATSGIICEGRFFEFQDYSGGSPIPVWTTITQWLAYESQFGTEYPILQAIVDNAAGGTTSLDDAYNNGSSITADAGAVSINGPASPGNVCLSMSQLSNSDVINMSNAGTGAAIYITGAGSHKIQSSANLLLTATNEVQIEQNNSETNWYDTDAAALRLSGTATQGMAIVSPDDLTIGATSTANLSLKTLSGDLILAPESSGEVQIEQNNSETNWYDADAAALRLSGTATQGMVVSTDKDLTVGVYDGTTASGGFTVDIICQTAGAGTDATATLQALATGSAGEGAPEALAKIYSYSLVGDATSELYAAVESTSDDALSRMVAHDGTNESVFKLARIGGTGFLDLTLVSYVDFNSSELREIGAASYTRNVITVTTNDFTLDPDNGIHQFATITANSTWDLSAPTGGSSRTTLIVYNSDASDHTLTITGMIGAYIHWVGSAANGFNCVAGEYTIVTVVYDTTNRWIVSVSASTEESF